MKPIPELIQQREWVKRNSDREKNVNIKDGIINVPFDDSLSSQSVRIHEYFHIKWSPIKKINSYSRKHPLYNDVIGAFEDERVNYLGKQINIDISQIMEGITFPKLNLIDTILIYVSSRQYKIVESLQSFFDTIPINLKTITDKLIDRLHQEPTFETVEIVSEILLNILTDKSSELFNEISKSTSFRIDLVKFISEEHQKIQSKSIYERAIRESGELKIVKYPFKDYRKQVNIKTIKKLPSERGMYFKHIHRDLTDELVFNSGRIDKFRIGTLLIDTSGSMNLIFNDIQNIIQKSPGSVVATYSASKSDNIGYLHILAKQNRCLKKIPPFPSSNIVDFPSLLWLVKQKPPFYWLCDGVVTGKGDMTFSQINESCDMIVKKYRIKQFLTMNSLKKFLQIKRG